MQAWEDYQPNNISIKNNQNVYSQSNRAKIAIAIPYIGKMEPEFVDRTYVPLRYIPTDFCDKLPFLCRVPSVSVARDTLVTEALKVNADYIFFVDTDIIFEKPLDPNIALRQLYDVINKNPNEKDGKIVSGSYRARQKQGMNYAMWIRAGTEIKGYAPISQWTGNFIEVDVTGMGCCLISVEIFKNIQPPWFRWEKNGDISEDFYFFELAKQYGYNLKVFTDVRASHIGTLKVKWDGTICTPDM